MALKLCALCVLCVESCRQLGRNNTGRCPTESGSPSTSRASFSGPWSGRALGEDIDGRHTTLFGEEGRFRPYYNP